MCVCAHVHTCMPLCVYMPVYMHGFACVGVCACVHACMPLCVGMGVCVCVCVCMSESVCVCVCVSECVCVYVGACIRAVSPCSMYIINISFLNGQRPNIHRVT